MPLNNVVVDLTPVLPGGENGGAKAFATQLVARLAERAPATRFVLFTQAASHDELAFLDGPNVRRMQVVGEAATAARASIFRSASRALRHLPEAVPGFAARLGYRLHARFKRAAARTATEGLRADLLFCPFTAPTYRWPGTPTVCTVYDLQYRAHPEFFTPEDRGLRDMAFRDACRHANALAAISDFTREAVLREGNIEARRVTTIYIRLAQPDAPTASSSGFVETLGASSGRYFLYPANLWRHKNHERLLEAFARAAREGLAPDITLVCTGTGDERRAALSAKASDLGVGSRVAFPGFVDAEALREALAHALALIYPSLHEGFGMPVVEAMAHRVPVACSHTTALPEIADDAALLFDPLDIGEISRAMIALAADPALRERLVAAGRPRAARFTDVDRMADEYLALFARAASPEMRR